MRGLLVSPRYFFFQITAMQAVIFLIELINAIKNLILSERICKEVSKMGYYPITEQICLNELIRIDLGGSDG